MQPRYAGPIEPIRAVLGNDVSIHVQPTPEVDRMREAMAQMEPEGVDQSTEGTYDPAIPADVVAGVHRAAARLYRAAPWDVVPDDGHVLGLDVPKTDAIFEQLNAIPGVGGAESRSSPRIPI